MAVAGIAILLLSFCALSVEGIRSLPAVTGDAPAFCHNADCPKFTTKEEHDTYEIREYEKGGTRQSTRRCGLIMRAVLVHLVQITLPEVRDLSVREMHIALAWLGLAGSHPGMRPVVRFIHRQ